MKKIYKNGKLFDPVEDARRKSQERQERLIKAGLKDRINPSHAGRRAYNAKGEEIQVKRQFAPSEGLAEAAMKKMHGDYGFNPHGN